MFRGKHFSGAEQLQSDACKTAGRIRAVISSLRSLEHHQRDKVKHHTACFELNKTCIAMKRKLNHDAFKQSIWRANDMDLNPVQ
uniref:Uncharacterized protein n=1 Tax=Caenorhabditis japonica TaxID=281687 RepID=A0A8R1I650_CAEJA